MIAVVLLAWCWPTAGQPSLISPQAAVDGKLAKQKNAVMLCTVKRGLSKFGTSNSCRDDLTVPRQA